MLISNLWVTRVLAESVSVSNLYEARVPVSDQSESSREAGFQLGLENVLKRVTGKASVSTLPEAADIIKQVDSLVSQFNYRDLPESERSNPYQRYFLQVSFNEKALNGLLRQSGLPIWGAVRPPVLVWMAQEERGRRDMVSGESILKNGIDAAAKGWGVPVIYPLYDFEDASALTTSDLWGMFIDPIQQASQRYGVNTVLAVRVWPSVRGEGYFNARSLLLFQQQAISADYRDIAAKDLTDKLMTTAASHMASYYAVAADGSPGRPVRVAVDGIDTVSDYASLIQYFDGLTAVRQVIPVRVRGSQVLLEVTIDGSMEQLSATIKLDRTLSVVAVAAQPQQPEEEGMVNHWLVDFDYRWVK
ncbi:DUF2066 domain-containing protein [Sansalvadorimonas verongulae]|uniref:DUF2066 domain-containing protein n=1 Tax=Sansalvadorimonas verongulae TaxID=2172824 RepID=UPI0018AD1887|nr:DUF2066 domain-containing protein [Sansalvadorimonas verongulae]